MTSIVHIVPLGCDPQVLIGSIRHFPVDRVVLVSGTDASSPREKEAEDAAAAVRKGLGSVRCDVFHADIGDLESVVLSLVEKIISEKRSGFAVLVNLSGSAGPLGIASYLAALSTGSAVYIGLPEYKDGGITGVRKVLSVPLLPLKELLAEKRDIIRALGKNREGLMLEDLIKKAGKLREASSERSRLSYHISDLKKDGLVESFKKGRNVLVKPTLAGLLYSYFLMDETED
ncbi:MAG: DUF6293 family protein [Candidatus Altiarchaeia archaeon]